MKIHKAFIRIILALAFFSLSPNILANNLHLHDLNGKSVQLDDFKGKAIWLDFWASWCLPCRASFPWMNEMQKKYQSRGLKIIAVNLDKDRTEVNRFLDHYPANFTILLDPAGSSARQYKVRGMPSSYMINRQGQVIKQHLGFRKADTAKLEADIQQLLNSKP